MSYNFVLRTHHGYNIPRTITLSINGIYKMTLNNKPNYSLTYLESFNIKNEAEGLLEPSGLVLSHGGNALWTISDDTSKIFKISLTGKLKKAKSFKISDSELEGITLIQDGEFLLVVKESNNEIIKIKIETQQVTNRKCLDEMAGYDAIAHHFSNGVHNKGLEGITWNQNTGTIFVIKECSPGLMMEISADLQTIVSHCLLNHDNGFYDADVSADELDFSDICYDQTQNRFWIISDMARRLFLYDWQANKVLQSLKLGYGQDGEYREIEKAEGIAIDPDENRLYIVSDETARLYTFDIR